MIKRDISLITDTAENKAYFLDPSQGMCIARGNPLFLLQCYNDYKTRQALECGMLEADNESKSITKIQPTLLAIQDEINLSFKFPFHPSEINLIHRQKDKEGWGYWYRLKDGRVFNSMGKESDTNLTLYDTGNTVNDVA